MPIAAWNETYSVSNGQLDSDHKILFKLLAQLHEVVDTGQSREVVGSVVSVLAEYAEHHFRREESLMAEAGVPGLEEHCTQHRLLSKEMSQLRDRYVSGERGVLGEEVLLFINKWLSKHILVTDKAYVPWLSDARPAGDERGTPA